MNSLTEKEKAVLDLLLKGRNGKEIAQALGLELSTVKNRLSHIYKKLGVKNRIECAIKMRPLVDGAVDSFRV